MLCLITLRCADNPWFDILQSRCTPFPSAQGKGMGLVCTRRFPFHEFYNFLLFNFLFFLFFFRFGLFVCFFSRFIISIYNFFSIFFFNYFAIFSILFFLPTTFNPIQTGGWLFEPPLRQNRDNSYTERPMTFKFSDFS